MKVKLTLISGNSKTGPIPVSMTEEASCPDACSFKNNGCYAKGWPTVRHWNNVPVNGVDWIDFCVQVADLPTGQFWRHDAAGDLANAPNGTNNTICADSLAQLVAANHGRAGFTYTHKPVSNEAGRRGQASVETLRANRAAISDANLRGFTVNVSCDSLAELDSLGEALPAVVVLPMPHPIADPADAAMPAKERRDRAMARGIEQAPKTVYTEQGRRVVVCPAQYREDTTCDTCRLCSRVSRSAAVGFWAHGFARNKVSNIVSSKSLVRKAG